LPVSTSLNLHSPTCPDILDRIAVQLRPNGSNPALRQCGLTGSARRYTPAQASTEKNMKFWKRDNSYFSKAIIISVKQ